MACAGLLLVSLCLSVFMSVNSQDCKPCDERPCQDPISNDDCLWGTVRRKCVCCSECAKGLNEPCGGASDELGICGPGMQCISKSQGAQSQRVCEMRLLLTQPGPFRFFRKPAVQ